MLSAADGVEVALLEAALALTDGTSVDWEALRARCRPEQRGPLGCLEALASLSSELSLSSARVLSDAEVALCLPTRWGPLLVETLIGRGSYGAVYKAWDSHLQRHVALKLLRRQQVADLQLIDEARRLARVRHPNVVTVHGADVIDGRTGFWMELLAGGTLAGERQTAAALSSSQIVRIGIDLASALDAVHAAGLLHRDIKPQNVMRAPDGRILLMDFGAGYDVTTPGGHSMELAGTPRYMAPEVLAGAPASKASDVYSLGVLLYWLASGEFPVSGRTLGELRAAHQRRERTALNERAPQIPKQLAAVIDRASCPDAARRFTSASELREALRGSLRRRTAVWVAAAAATLAVASSASIYKSTRQDVVDLSTLVPRDFVLVTRFDNTTGDSTFDGSVEYLVARELGASKVLEVVPGERVIDALQLMKKPLDTAVNRETGREVALRDGRVKALIAGRIVRDGDGYAVTTELLDPADDTLVASVDDSATNAKDVLEVVSHEAHQIERLFSERRSIIAGTTAVEQVSTPSLAAFQKYNEAIRLYFAYRPDDALREAEGALLADPDFPSGWYLKAYLLQDLLRPKEETRQAAARALTLAQSAPEWERHFILGSYAWMNNDCLSAAPEFEFVVRLRPQFEAGALHLIDCSIVLEQPQRAIAPLKAAAEQRPLDVRANYNAAFEIMRLKDNIDEARPYIARLNQLLSPARANAPDFYPAALWMQSLPAYQEWRTGDIANPLTRARALSELTASWPKPWQSEIRLVVGELFLTLGRLRDAEPYLQAYGDWGAAALDEAREDSAGLRTHLRSMPLRPDVQPLVDAGLIDEARARVAQHRHGLEEVLQDLGRAALALHDGDADGMTLLQATMHRPMVQLFSPDYQRGCALLARTLSSHGRTLEAIAELERCVAVPPRFFGDFNSTTWMQNQLRLADEYRRVGRVAEAVKVERSLRRQLAYADADHPLVLRLNAR